MGRLSLFGSVARNEADPKGDIDLAAGFDSAAKISLIDLVRLEDELGALLGREVQILPEPIRKDRLRVNVERDRIVPSRDSRIVDCLHDILRIERHVEGLDQAGLTQDELRCDAVERCLERICEAAFRMGEWAAVPLPDQPWGEIRGMGNRLRHA